MAITKLSSRELNQDLGRAKRAALDGPVVITDRGRPAHVLLSYADYLRLTAEEPSLLEALSMPGMDDIEFEPATVHVRLRVPDFDH